MRRKENRRALNQVAHWYVGRKALATGMVSIVTIALRFAVLVTD